MRFILTVAGGFLLLSLAGCQSLGYYAQSVKGQMQINHRAQPIEDWLHRGDVSDTLKRQLESVLAMRQFASEQLALPNNKSYTLYADLQRPYVVWNIFAAPEFSFKPYTWCYPVIGCQAYRGYFSKPPAAQLAQQLKQQGFDVSVGGVKAYSTLGWFNDPVLNTFVNFAEVNLASLIFHELSHQVVYVKDDTVFNESFATFVETKGVELWLTQNGQAEELQRFKQRQQFDVAVVALLAKYKAILEQVYAVDSSEADKRAEKKRVFAELKQAFQEFAKPFDSKVAAGWSRWFAQSLNNANLIAFGTYYDKVGDFENLFADTDSDFEQFFSEVRRLAKLDKSKREAFFATLDKQ